MTNTFSINELKEIYKLAVYNQFLSPEHQTQLFTLIQEKDAPPLHIELALETLTTHPKNCQKIITIFHRLPIITQTLASIILSSYQDASIQIKLFNLLQTISNEEVTNTLIISMAKSPYLNIAPILDHLYTDNKIFKEKLIFLLELTPIKKFEFFIAATPELPHEALFRRIYGHTAINNLRGTTTNPHASQPSN